MDARCLDQVALGLRLEAGEAARAGVLLPPDAEMVRPMSETTAHEPIRTDFIDFPTGWRIMREAVELTHHENCSATAGLLCDCIAMPLEWARRAVSQEPQLEEEIVEATKRYIPWMSYDGDAEARTLDQLRSSLTAK